MHVLRPQFHIEEQRALEFASRRGFGMIVAADERGPRASHVPFVLDQRDGRAIVQIHFTAKNPLVPLADGTRRFLLIVAGDDAYISNDWYSSRDNVSTGSTRRCICRALPIRASWTRTAVMATRCLRSRRAAAEAAPTSRRWRWPSGRACWRRSASSIS